MEEMHNNGYNRIEYGRVDDDIGGKDKVMIETAFSEGQQKRRTVEDKFC